MNLEKFILKYKKMDQALKTLLRKNRDETGVWNTHVSLISPKGKYCLDRKNLEIFWKIYCDYISQNENAIIGIAEKSQQYLPILVDVDLKIQDDMLEEGKEKLYDEEQLLFIVKTYQTVLKKILSSYNEEELVCVVLEKEMYQQEKNDIVYFKGGIHLTFPYIFLDKTQQEIHLIPRIQEILNEKKLFRNLGIEDSGKVIDNACCRVPWLLYGSRKNEENKPYLLTKIFDTNLKEISIEKAFAKYQIFDEKEELINIKGKEKYYLPRILSIIPYSRMNKEIKKGILSPLKEKIKEKKSISITQEKNFNLEENIKIAKKLLPMLSNDRADNRNEWMTIGWILYNITNGAEEGLELWCDFSSRCEEKYDENACIHHWEKMIKKDIGIGTLKYYAKSDNPLEYIKYTQEQTKKYIKNSLDGSHNDIAKALYSEYGDEFVCSSIRSKNWYQFDGQRWIIIDEGYSLREKISSNLVSKFAEIQKQLIDESATKNDKAECQMIGNKIKSILKLISQLKNANFKSNIMKECAEVFYNPDFNQKLDTNPFLIGFKNGVYDLQNNIFRKGRPEDYLSKNMPINYRNFNENDDKVHDVKTFLEQVFPDKDVRKYFLDVSSDLFVGGNIEKSVYFWTGEGDNGKSVTQKFFDIMLGKYCVKLNTNIITGNKPNIGGANAEMARCGGGVRLAVMEEPNNDEMINTGIFKSLSGNDTFFARDLFEKGKDTAEITPLFKLVFVTNKLPRFKGADKAVWNRVKVIPFESTFCKSDNPAPDSYEEQMLQKRFPMDKTLGSKIPSLVEAFAWILLEHRKKIAGKPRIEPDKVRVATELYRKQNDVYRQFIEEIIIEDKNRSIKLDELYTIYRDWHKNSLPGMQLPVKQEIEEHFIKLWGNLSPGKKWIGYRQRTDRDDIKNQENIEEKENEDDLPNM